jgi:hypothetical protein
LIKARASGVRGGSCFTVPGPKGLEKRQDGAEACWKKVPVTKSGGDFAAVPSTRLQYEFRAVRGQGDVHAQGFDHLFRPAGAFAVAAKPHPEEGHPVGR